MSDDTTITAAGHDLGVPGAVAPPVPPPVSMAEAASRKGAFLADKVKTTALMNGDVGATNEWRLINDHLWQAPAIIGPRDEAVQHLNESTGYALPKDAQGRPQEQGVGSTLWLLRVSEEEAEGHYSALSRWRGPAAAAAERERIARLKGNKGK
jgi:hypothetical protein